MPPKRTVTELLVAQMTVPKGAEIVRIPEVNGRPSATAQPFSRPVLNWATPIPAANAGQRVLPPDESIIVLTYDPLCAIIQEDKNNNQVQLVQQWLIGDNPANALISVAQGAKSSLDKDLYASQNRDLAGNVTQPWHGTRLFARKFKGKYWIWCDCGQTGTAQELIQVFTGLVALAAGDKVVVDCWRLNEGNEVRVFNGEVAGPIAANGIVSSNTIPVPDYYRVDLYCPATNTTAVNDFQIYNTAKSAIMVHKALPDLVERQMDLVQAIRIVGAACNIKNTASEQNAAGSWVGDQIEASIIWTTFLRGAAGQNGFQKLATQRGNEVIELKKNGYMFIAPEDISDLHYAHPFTFNASGKVSNTLNEEMEEHPYIVLYLKAGGTTDATDPARSIQLLNDWGVEYISEGQWPMMGTSPATAEELEAAIRIVGSMEQVHTNPAFKDILKSIGKYARLSAPALALLGPYGKAASLVVGGVGAGLGHLGYRSRKTARPDAVGNDSEKDAGAPPGKLPRSSGDMED